MLFEGTHPNKMYKDVTKYILNNGYKIAPRGQSTMEVQPAVNFWRHPDKMVVTVPGRLGNPFFTLFEALWIAGGRGDSESVCFYNSNLAQFLDEGYTDYHAPYGVRIRHWGVEKNSVNSLISFRGRVCDHDQLRDCYELLKKDPDTRQAVVVLWIPVFDNSEIKTNDRPCNDLAFFKVREGRLNMTVSNRSNDLHWGLYGANIMQFSMLQRILAGCLHYRIGHYWHHSDSLHIYNDRDAISENIIRTDREFDVYDYVEPYDLTYEWKDLNDFDERILRFFDFEKSLRNKEIDYYPELQIKNSGIGNYLEACLAICYAYVLHKNKEYEKSSSMLMRAYYMGLKDTAIACMEFVNRKHQKIEFSAYSTFNQALSSDLTTMERMKIINYITDH